MTSIADLNETALKAKLKAEAAERATLLGRCRALLARADESGRDITANEQRQIDDMTARMGAIDDASDAARLELAAIAEEIGSVSRGRVVPPQRPNGSGAGRSALPVTGGLFNQMFPTAGHDQGRFEDIGAFAKAVYQRDPRLFQNASGMQTAVGGDGGFYVPPGFLAGLVDGSLQAESIRPRSTVVPMTTNSLTIPLFDTANRTSTLAGLDGLATQEGATATNQTADVRYITLRPTKFVVLVPTTEELLNDAPAIFASLLQRYMGEAMAAKLDYQFLHGTGAGAPMGIVNAASTVSVAKESSQTAATVVSENIAKMIARLATGSFGKAVWLANPSVLVQLFQLKQLVKNVAGTENVGGFGPDWFSVDSDGTMSLVGRPLIVNERCAALGTVGDIVLADCSRYLVGLRQDATLAVDNSIGFKEGEIYFKLTMRVDGQPWLDEAETMRLGGTVSPFVTLATRA